MADFTEPTPVPEPGPPEAPPTFAESLAPKPPEGQGGQTGKKKATGIAAALLALLAKAKTALYFLAAGLKFAGLGKVLLTGGSMLLSVWAYSTIFGLWFAVGFVILIFVHEMGHVYAAVRCGIKASAPIFIPFMGALIFTRMGKGKKMDAIVGIGGPVAGTLGSAVCALIFLATRSDYFLGLAYVGFLLNLFNLTPIYPLDGGWIVRAISPILWLIGIVVIIAMLFAGFLHNPLVLLLVLLGLPTMYRELRSVLRREPSEVSPDFRLKMGFSYVGVIAACLAGMIWCESLIPPQRSAPQGDDPQVSARSVPIRVRIG